MISRKRLSVCVGMLLLAVSVDGRGHWEDPTGCHQAKKTLGQYDYVTLYEGLAEDGRDWVVRQRAVNRDLVVEEHYYLLPPSQWPDPKTPAHLPILLSAWLDWDGDGHYGEWYIFARGRGAECQDALHFTWDPEAGTYRLVPDARERADNNTQSPKEDA